MSNRRCFAQAAASRLSRVLLLSAAAIAGCVGADEPAEDVDAVALGSGLDHAPDAMKELFVTDLGAVNDPGLTRYAPGKWNTDPEGGFSFGRLIDNMSPVEKPTALGRSGFVMSWLRLWETSQTVNGQTLAARPLIRDKVITPWKLASIGKNGNTALHCSALAITDSTCALSFDPDVVPFRLLAVEYRPDLRRVPSADGSQPGSAGQGRFMFGVLGADRQPLPFTVIFEYMIPVSGASDIQAVAKKYHELGKLSFGKDFNKKLHERTAAFTKWNVAPSRQNGSALLQIRTNEVALAPEGSDPTSPKGLLWEMREFVLGPSGKLVPDTVKQEPHMAMNGSADLGAWASANSAALLAGTYEMPASFQGKPFLAASSFVPFGLAWSVPGVPEDVRRAFGLGTCGGCHRSETGTIFLHVKNRAPDAPAALSSFLTAELAANGPRMADYKALLTADVKKIEDGKGRDFGEEGKPKKGDDEDEDEGEDKSEDKSGKDDKRKKD
jgi:hypothetical protein